MDEALNGMDLLSLYPYSDKPNILLYSDLKDKSLDQILGKSNKAIILFRNAQNFGHWCCIYRHKNTITFFDSYGCKPDDQYKFIPKNIAKRFNGHIRRLTKMLYDEAKRGYEIHYNEYGLQSSDPRIATCGRWCIIRLQYPDISINDFNKIFTDKKISPDELVYRLTL